MGGGGSGPAAVSGEELGGRAGSLRAQPALLGFPCFQYLRRTFVYIYKISQATTCSYTVVGKGRKGKRLGRARRTSLEAPPKPMGRKWTLNFDKEMGKEKERGLRLSHPALVLSLKRKGRRLPSRLPFTAGCEAQTETAPGTRRV